MGSWGTGMERWGESSDKLYKERKTAIDKFHKKISQPNPKPSRPPKRIVRKPKFSPGDCISVQVENGQYGAVLVLAVDTLRPEYPLDLLIELDYLSDEPPTIEVFTQRKWLKLTHHKCRGGIYVLWYGAARFRETKPRLNLVGNIPILTSDPQESMSYAAWHQICQQILIQREWDAERNG